MTYMEVFTLGTMLRPMLVDQCIVESLDLWPGYLQGCFLVNYSMIDLGRLGSQVG